MFTEPAFILPGLCEQMPYEIHLDPESEAEDASAPESGSARTARERRDAAERKRAERARRRAEGIPEPRLVEAAIATALCDLSRRGGLRARVKEQRSYDGIAYGLDAVLGQAMEELVERRGVAQPQAKRALMQRLGLTRQA
ncbi:hypothetical protein SAMN02799622_04210 [Methylobacterium sp. UNC378MF]|uniref:Uncharacterized protein n=1 Tax=Methylobacterium oryzae TaxID=334852 RepID=A0ABU7TMU5_9HYPH|nr:hypothetical protein [Methylobacterium sp. UNC378MF]SDA28018.1 hypothetical protein SAMN02799622_04210 [Methylobacterium sp. UNC378MF]